ncbi:7-carboxy-7-deazaguanine synthase QueE [Streptoalloteichus hindustanus]|uniref:7-carboxy-7-deazaguanine synthase n=1 Tax=Streptoalloteichus hindustanus TaxID=2017 RepID=A0A1M5DB62_STRHI|nr:7-carboxy-7-deazaguanine synthase QueE [Streptoalloteichus hindustanus]SHF64176.1 Organic radical activating enzyme [Streptoalloteichus hindustanus]
MNTLTVAPERVEGSAILTEKFESFQGEGPWTGQRCVFVRFSRCNLRCGFCDTPESWDWSRYNPAEVSERAPVAELVSWVRERGVDMMVITGGEPMLQQPAMTALARGLANVRVQVETNGTIAPTPELASLVDLWVVSPKLANSGMTYSTRIKPAALSAFAVTDRAVFKFVVTEPDRDLDEIAQLVEEHQLAPVWVMPEGTTREKILAGMDALYSRATERGWNVSTRLHILTGAR